MSDQADPIVRAAANWGNLSTPFGLVVALAGRATIHRGPDRLWIADRYRFSFPKAAAFTIGSVILIPGTTWDELTRRNPHLLAHERTHAAQWALCLGLPFLPSYLLATAWSRLRTGTNHAANIFETTAGLTQGGYEAGARRAHP